MRNTKLLSLLSGIVSSIIFFPAPSSAFIPVPNESGEYSYDEQGNLVIDSDFSFSSMKELDHDCNFEADPQIIELAGYDPSLTCNAGDRPEDVLPFGYFTSYGFQNLSINDFNNSDGTSITLDRVKIIHDLSIRELSNSVSGLKDYKIKDITLFKDSLTEYLQEIKLKRLLNASASEVSEDIKARVYGEASQYIKSTVNSRQEQVLLALGEGADLATASIFESLNPDPDTQLSLNLEDINSAVKTGSEQKLLAVKGELDEEIDEFLNNQYNKTAEEINVFVRAKIEEYELKTKIIVGESFEDLKNKIEAEILAEVAFDPDEIDWIEYENLFADYEQAVVDFGANVLNSASAEISDYVDRELEKIENIAEQIPDDLGNLLLSNFDLENYTVGDIPGLNETPVEDFENYKTAAISEIPGASDYSFSNLPSFNINFGTGIAIIDLVLGTAEKFADRSISGSLKESFNFAHCRRYNSLNDGCDHIELGGPIPFNRGTQWVSGDSQEVRGGKNLLENFNGGKEPTGRLPAYKSPLKMVLRNNDEQTDTTELYLALQFCVTDIFGVEHCTPHNIVEFPIYTFKVGDYIFLGITI